MSGRTPRSYTLVYDRPVLNLNDARLFVKVVEWGGFSAAARALRVPKSTLSKRVAELEHALGATLLRRTSRRFVVTAVGREFLRHAAEMVALADAAEEVVRGRLAEPTGPVRVTCSVPTAQAWLAPLLPRLAARFPKVRVSLHATDRFVDVVRDGFDIAVRDHFLPLPDSTLVQRRVAVDELLLVAAPRYLSRRKAPKRPAELAAHDVLLTEPRGTWTLRLGDAPAVAIALEARFAADESTVLLAAAREGLGIASLPASACGAAIAERALKRVLPEWAQGHVTTTLLLPDRRAQLPAVRAVADAIVGSAAK